MITASKIRAAVAEELRSSKPLDEESLEACRRRLQFVYHLIVASEDLLREAVEYSAGPLQSYFRAHLAEETGHAGWLRRDLGDVGKPSHLVMAMAGSQFYWIRYVDSCALLGYMVSLECFPTSIESVERLERMHGSEMFKTLRHHAQHDIEHGTDVLNQIDRLSEQQREIVMDNAVQMARYMALATHHF